MPSLLEKLRLRNENKVVQQPQLGETEAAKQLLQAKTGKASVTTMPISTESERAVAQETAGQLGQVKQQAQIAQIEPTAQAEQQKQQFTQKTAQIEQASREVAAKVGQQLKDIESKVGQAATTLRINKQAAQLDARLFQRRLSDAKYIQDIKQEAQINRLEDDNNFKEYITQQALGEDLWDLMKRQEYSSILGDERRTWEEKFERMNVDNMLAMAKEAARDAAKKAQWDALTGMAQMGGQAASSYYGSRSSGGTTGGTGA